MTVKSSATTTEFLEPAPPQPLQQKKKIGRVSLQQVFNASKNTIATHPKLCLQLIKLYQKADFDEFFAEFLNLLKICLVVGEKHPQVERTLSFVARFTTADKRPKEDKDDQTGKENKPDEEVDGGPAAKDKEADGGTAAKDKEASTSRSSLTVTDSELGEDDEVDPFLINMFQFLLNNHEANSNSVRYRVCQLINRILNSMGESASLDDDLFSTIYDTMLQRLMDKKPAVRVQAILALNRLQDPRNKDCPVIKAYRYHLSMDPASDVRRAALLSTAITFQTLPDVLQRTRDKNHLVRRQAYLVLAQKVHIRSLQISQRVRLLSEGLNDRSDIVRMAVQKNLLQAWLRFVNGSVLDLLTCLDVEASTKGAELALDTLFLDVPASTLVQNFGLLGDDKLIPLGDIKPESVLYWKCLVKHLKKEQAEEELDHVLPDLSAFCAYTRAFALSEEPSDGEPEDEHAIALRQMEKEFVLQQLIHITTCYDLSDEVGRQSLEQLVRVLLVFERVGEGSINGLVDVFGRIYPPHSRVTQLAEIISDVREPAPAPLADGTVATPASSDESVMTLGSGAVDPAAEERAKQLSENEQRANKIKVAKVRVQLNQVREELEECVRSLDLDRAQGLKLKLRALELEHETIQQLVATPAQTPRSEHQRTAASVAGSAGGGEAAAASAASAATAAAAAAAAEELQEKDDPQTLARCLTIVCQMLRSPEITVITPTLHSLHDNLLLPCLENQEPLVRKLAVQALSLLCLVSKEMAQKHLLLFVQISHMDMEAIQLLALQAVFDLLLLYGVEQFSAATEGAANLGGDDQDDLSGLDDVNAVVAILSKHLESEECEVRTAVAMGLCKLLQASRITSPKLLTHLTLLWYNPITEEDTMLRHMLGVFFPLYASQGGSSQACVVASVLPTLRALLDAAPRSSLATVDVDDVANFLVSITSPAVVTKKTGKLQHVNLHDSLVFTVLGEILAYPDSGLARHLCKVLRHLNLSATNYPNLRQLQVLADKVAKKMRERSMQVAFEKFQASIKEYLKLAPVKEEEEELQNDTQPIDAQSADGTPADKTVECTFARRRRQLYTTHNDADLLSSEAESESGTPAFAEPEEVPAIVPKIEAADPELEAAADDSVAEEGVTLVSSLHGQELELRTPCLDRSISSEDMFASPELPSSGRHSGSRAKRSPRKAATTPIDTDSEEESAAQQSNRPSRKKRSPRKPVTNSTGDNESEEESAVQQSNKPSRKKRSPRKPAADSAGDNESEEESAVQQSNKPSREKRSPRKPAADSAGDNESEEESAVQQSNKPSREKRSPKKSATDSTGDNEDESEEESAAQQSNKPSRKKRSPKKSATDSAVDNEDESEEESAAQQSNKPSRKKRSPKKSATDSAVDNDSDASVKKRPGKASNSKSSPEKGDAVVADTGSDTDDTVKLVAEQRSEEDTMTTQDDSDSNIPSPVKSKRAGRVSGSVGASRSSRTAARVGRGHTEASPALPAPRSGRTKRSQNSSPIPASIENSTDEDIISPTPSTPSEGKKRGSRTRGTATTTTPSRKALKVASKAPLTTVADTSSADSAESFSEALPETLPATGSVTAKVRRRGRPKKTDKSTSPPKVEHAAAQKTSREATPPPPSPAASARPRQSRGTSARLSSARESPACSTGGVRRNIRGKPVIPSSAATDAGPIESSGSSSPASRPATKRLRRGRPSSSPSRSTGTSSAVSSPASTVSSSRSSAAVKTPSTARRSNLRDTPSESSSSSTAPRSTRAARSRQ